jgi:hypothetical protein
VILITFLIGENKEVKLFWMGKICTVITTSDSNYSLNYRGSKFKISGKQIHLPISQGDHSLDNCREEKIHSILRKHLKLSLSDTLPLTVLGFAGVGGRSKIGLYGLRKNRKE